MVNKENYEEYMVLYADGELNPQEEAALLEYVKLHPNLQAELDLYASTKLMPDETIVYADKEALLKPEGGGRTIFFGGWQTYAAAASVALLVALFFYNRRGEDITVNDNTNNIAQHDPPVTHHPETNKQPDPKPQNTTLPTTTPKTAIASNNTTKQHQPINRANKNIEPIDNSIEKQNRHTQEVVKLETATQRYLTSDLRPQVADVGTATAPVNTTPSATTSAAVATNNNGNKAINNYLPVLRDNMGLINGIESTVAQKVDKAKQVATNLKDSEVVLKFGKKEILLVRL